MAEKMGASYETADSLVSDDLAALQAELNINQLEQAARYPKTSEQIKASLQSSATKLQTRIEKTISSSEKAKDSRGTLEVVTKGNNTFALKSWGIESTFKFIPVSTSGKPEAARLVFIHEGKEYETFSVSIDSLADNDVDRFLGWANSANKELALSHDYKKLQEVTNLLNNEANRKNYPKYLKTYQTIMRKDGFTRPQTSTSRSAYATWIKSGDLVGYLDARWESIKQAKKSELDAAFTKKGLNPDTSVK